MSLDTVEQIAGVLVNLELATSKHELIQKLHKMQPGDLDELNALAKAMAAFCDNAVEVRYAREAQELAVTSLSGALSALADNKLNCEIKKTFPGAY